MITERNPADGTDLEIGIGFAGITDNVTLPTLEDLPGWPRQLQTDGALKKLVGRPGQSSHSRGLAGLFLREVSAISGQGFVPDIKLSDGQLTSRVLGPAFAGAPFPVVDVDDEQDQHDDHPD